ncbi:unnamed protein product [Rotaria sordida]|uniref:Uncharacterized protein n=1 Tax=Rotaria sordida TaxID=392033 RepID=A0A816GYX8_9BILA|nr:unnamed protein product [Rotaria sordida]CAF1679188.1 unnamed protein product [Rotaria sordida]
MREMYSRVAHDMGMFHYPLRIAIKQDFIQLVKLILNYKQLFNMKIEEAYTKRTALHIAAGKRSTEIISLLLEEDQLDLNGHAPLDIVWKLLNNLDYEFECREETLKLMLSHKCKFSSLKSLTEFYTNSNRNYQDTVMEDDKFD